MGGKQLMMMMKVKVVNYLGDDESESGKPNYKDMYLCLTIIVTNQMMMNNTFFLFLFFRRWSEIGFTRKTGFPKVLLFSSAK